MYLFLSTIFRYDLTVFFYLGSNFLFVVAIEVNEQKKKNQAELSMGGNPGITPDKADPFIDVLRLYITDKKKKQLELQVKIKDKLEGDFVTNQNIAIGYIRAVLPESPDNLKFYSDLYVRYLSKKLQFIPKEIQSDLKKARETRIKVKIGRFISE